MSERSNRTNRRVLCLAALAVAALIVTSLHLIKAAALPTSDRITPQSGQVGHTAVIHGDDLRGNAFEVRFGNALATEPRNPGGSSQNIKVSIPNKPSPSAPDVVTVTVKVDGVEAQYPNGPLQFTYAIPQPLPIVSSYVPNQVDQNTGFVLTLTGSNFLTGARTPEKCLALALGGSQSLQESVNLVGTPTDSSVSFSFAGLTDAGGYKILVGFTDAAGAEILAVDFVRPVDPPVISSYSTDPSPPLAHGGFEMIFSGTDFTNASGRRPASVTAEAAGSPVPSPGTLTGTPTETSFGASFGGLASGDYTIRVGFTDGTIATAAALLTVVE